MSGTPFMESEKKDKKVLKRAKVTYVESSVREEPKKPLWRPLHECKRILGDRAEARGPGKWDSHPLGKSGAPASEVRLKVYLDMKAKGFKGRNETARRFGVSPGFVTKWTGVYRAAEAVGAALGNVCIALSTRPPHTVRAPATDRVKGVALRLRDRCPFFGPKKLEHLIRERAPPGTSASASTIGRLIKGLGLQRDHKPYKRHKYVRFERTFSLHMAQTDFKEWGKGVVSIWVIDDHSRCILGYRVVANATTEVVKDLLREVISRHG